MPDRIPCSACGANILISTSVKNGGLCMPCKGGYRKDIEDSKIRYAEEKKYRESAEHKYWQWIVDQVHKKENGFAEMSKPDQLYFAINILNGEVYNGGFDQYFHNSSGDFFSHSVEGLRVIGATESLALLLEAREILFGDAKVPSKTGERRSILRSKSEEVQNQENEKLDILDKAFWAAPDKLAERLEQFAKHNDLYKNF
jgi:hypothetical protein